MSVRTTLLGQAKGSFSPRLHYQQKQGVDTGGKVRRPQDLGSVQCGPSQTCPICCQKTNSPRTQVPGACSSALEGAHGSEPHLGTANFHLHRQPAPQNTCTGRQLDLHFVQDTFHSTPHSHQEGGFAPFITANQWDKHHPRQSDFYKAKEL